MFSISPYETAEVNSFELYSDEIFKKKGVNRREPITIVRQIDKRTSRSMFLYRQEVENQKIDLTTWSGFSPKFDQKGRSFTHSGDFAELKITPFQNETLVEQIVADGMWAPDAAMLNPEWQDNRLLLPDARFADTLIQKSHKESKNSLKIRGQAMLIAALIRSIGLESDKETNKPLELIISPPDDESDLSLLKENIRALATLPYNKYLYNRFGDKNPTHHFAGPYLYVATLISPEIGEVKVLSIASAADVKGGIMSVDYGGVLLNRTRSESKNFIDLNPWDNNYSVDVYAKRKNWKPKTWVRYYDRKLKPKGGMGLFDTLNPTRQIGMTTMTFARYTFDTEFDKGIRLETDGYKAEEGKDDRLSMDLSIEVSQK